MINKILFITWDGPQTNYLESLFFPIFAGIQQDTKWQFHVVQFSWAEKAKHKQIAALAKRKNISYCHFSVIRKPHPLLGTLFTIVNGIGFLKNYIQHQEINMLMPRSILPSLMAKEVKKKYPELKIIFDADGLPLEERVDFNGLNPNGLQYVYLKKQETHMLKMADLVLTRSKKATQIHLNTMGKGSGSKFFKVSNGRDKTIFNLDDSQRQNFRKKLGLSPDQLLLVYCGSLGAPYGWDSMVMIFKTLLQTKPNSIFLILTQEDAYLKNRIPTTIQPQVRIIKGPFVDIPAWLNASDLAFAIREPRFSMQGVAPIKLGEYLLMGLPTIASKGIGDTEEILFDRPFVHLFDHQKQGEVEQVILWVENQDFSKKEAIREFAIQHFTLERSIEDYKKALNYLLPMT
jgi:glycosyltransferase involved in cell wall biosynthesis